MVGETTTTGQNAAASVAAESAAVKWYAPYLRARHALAEWTSHCLVVIGILVGIRVVEEVVTYLWWPHAMSLFGVLPLRFVFDAADLGLLGGFLTYGVYRVIVSYWVRDGH